MRRALVLVALAALAAPAGAAAAPSGVRHLTVDRREALAGGYVRVVGHDAGVVSGRERVAGLHRTGLRYRVEYELIGPRRRPPRLLLVEAENRGQPLLLGALAGLEDSAGPPAAADYGRRLGNGFLQRRRIGYARVQWQTGIAADVPATAQGAGEVIVRDFGRALRRRFHRLVLGGVSQGAFFADTFLAEGFNRDPATGRRVFPRALTLDGIGNWMAINRLAGAGPQTPYLRADGRPLSYHRMLRRPRTDPRLIDVANYTDFYRLRAGLTDERPPPAGVRRYDWPSPHQSFAPSLVFGPFNCNGGRRIPLNPLRNGPYLRALLGRLAAGRPLPPSRRFRLGRAPATSPGFNGLPGARVRVPRIDALGQPLGGVRFPELDSPLGRLQPVSLSPAVTTSIALVCGNSGGYDPFTAARARGRYPTAAGYARRVRGAVHGLVAGGYLLPGSRGPALRAARRAYARAVTR